MQGAYSTYFDNPFLSLRMGRPAYKAQAEFSLRAARTAKLSGAFTPLLEALETAIGEFDENLAGRNQSTSGGTLAFAKARKEWLAFVDDTMKDYVTPKLRKLPVYADFRKFGKSRLADLDQDTFVTQAKALLDLYRAQQKALYPELGSEAQALYDALVQADTTRDTQTTTIDAAILDLADDRTAIARAQRRFKAQLELAYDKPEKVYSFFDFSDAEYSRTAQKKGTKKIAAAPAPEPDATA